MSTDTCRKGHPYTPENMRIVAVKGVEFRQCRACDKQRAQDKRNKLRGEKRKFQRGLKNQCLRGHELSGDNLYHYEKNGRRQRRCRACDAIREQGYRDRDETVQPTKNFCANGHELSGDNLFFRTNGFAACRQCALAGAERWQANHREDHLKSKQRGHEKERRSLAAAFKSELIRLSGSGRSKDAILTAFVRIWESHRITGGRSLFRGEASSESE